MKRYALFTYDTYYPSGGWGDFYDSYDTIEEAVANFQRIDHNELIDLQTGERITVDGPGRKRA
jgi:hypothetical protein